MSIDAHDIYRLDSRQQELLAADLLIRVHNLRLEFDTSTSLPGDFVQRNERTKKVEVIVEVKSSGNLTASAISEFIEQIEREVEEYSPDRYFFVQFSELTQSKSKIWFDGLSDSTDRILQIYDISWIQQQLNEHPDLAEKYGLTPTSKGEDSKKADTDSFTYEIPDSLHDNIHALGSTWNGNDDKTMVFLNEERWENGYDDKYIDKVNSIREGSIVILKSTVRKSKPPAFRVKALGIVTKNKGNGKDLDVDWVIKTGNIDVPNSIIYKVPTFTKLRLDELQAVLSFITPEEEDWSKLIEKHLGVIGSGEYTKNRSTIAGNHADSTEGVDKLDFREDVTAFAKLIASQALKPPLAIGLFGKWGQGKSFFMEKLRSDVKEYSNLSRWSGLHKDLYCHGIAQIHFNAWSYLDANLWANIVTKIFEHINEYISGEHVKNEFKEKVRDDLANKLLLTKEERDDLKQLRIDAQERIEVLEKDKKVASESLAEKVADVKKASLFNALKTVEEKFDVQKNIKEAVESSPEINQTWEQFKQIVPETYLNNPAKAYEEVRSTAFFIKELLRPKWVKSTLILLFLLVLIILVGLPFLQVKIEAIKEWSLGWFKGISSMMLLIGPVILRVRQLSGQIRPVLSALWAVKTGYEKEIARVKSEHEQSMLALQQEIQFYQHQVENIELQIVNKNEEIRELNYKLEHALSSESLKLFIKKRLSSQDYQKHLGLVAMIRKDFETLSELFIGHNEELKSEEFQQQFHRPLERIVLYIDDLDRCPEDRVIEVLEAVNLLMAFPLFVVVVGVDPRWVKNALKKQFYTQFIGDHNKEGEFEAVSPSDYLEKIFQLPFHLKEATDESVKGMLSDLVAPFLAVEKSNEEATPADNANETDANENKRQDESRNKNPSSTENRPKAQFAPHLELTKEEHKMIRGFSKVLGTNPRAIKRFVNTYMVIKAHEDLMLTKGNEPLELKFIAFLLALNIGPYKDLLPGLRYFFTTLTPPINLGAHLNGDSVISGAPDEGDDKLRRKKKELWDYLKLDEDLLDEDLNMAYENHADFVKRFTFSELATSMERRKISEKLANI